MIAKTQHLGSNAITSAEGHWWLFGAETEIAVPGTKKRTNVARTYRTRSGAEKVPFVPPGQDAPDNTKVAIDSFFMRAWDVFLGGTFCLGTALGLEPSCFASLNVVFTAVWFFVVASVSRGAISVPRNHLRPQPAKARSRRPEVTLHGNS